MNLTKYFMIEEPMDTTVGSTDMPSIWNLQEDKPEKGHFMNLAGDSHDTRSVIMDSCPGFIFLKEPIFPPGAAPFEAWHAF